LEGIENAVGAGTMIEYSKAGKFKSDPGAADAICLAIVGEPPYAEGKGDSQSLKLPSNELRVLRNMEDECANLVVILISGRPLIITDSVDEWDALVSAWLPGTEGAGVADVLFGDLPFSGKLSYTWPASIEQLPLGSSAEASLFPFGFGLTGE